MAMIQALGNVSKIRGALKGAGVRHEDVVRTTWGQFVFFWDPEGNPLQYYESAFVRPDADPERISG